MYERGVGVGTAIRDALLGGSRSKVNTTYKEVVTYRTPGLKLVGRLMWIDGSMHRRYHDSLTCSLTSTHRTHRTHRPADNDQTRETFVISKRCTLPMADPTTTD